MKVLESLLGTLFFATILLGMCSTAAFSAIQKTQARLMIPWVALAAGAGYFLLATAYFSLPEVAATGPIRLDIPILAPFMLYALYVGVASLNRFSPKKPGDPENKDR